MSDASSIRKVTSPVAPAAGQPGPVSGVLASETQVGSVFYEGAIRFLFNQPGYNYIYTDPQGLSKSRKTGQAFINTGAQWAPVGNKIINIQVGATPTDPNDVTAFIADRAYNIASIQGAVSTAAGSAATAQVYTASGTTALASGVAATSTTINLNGTPNSVQTATLSATLANTQLAAGSRLGLVFTGAASSSVGLITIVLQPQ